jgi:galacturan 1,4-alpha-galacturonidase
MAFRNVAIRVFFLLLVVSAAFAKDKEEKKEDKKEDKKDEKTEGAASEADGTYDITKLGAKDDGKTDCTKVRNQETTTICMGDDELR